MKGVSNIDEILHQRLSQAEVLPPVEVWSKIEEDLRQKRRKKFFFWIWLVGLSTLGTGVWISRSDWALPQATSAAPTPQAPPSATEALATTAVPAHAPVLATTTAKENKALSTLNDKPTQFTSQNTPKGIMPDPGIGSLLPIKPLPLPGATLLHVEKTASLDAPTRGETGQQIFGKNQAVENHLPNVESSTSATPSLRGNGHLLDLPALNFVHVTSALKYPLAKPVHIVKKKKEQKKCFDFHKNSTAWFVDAYAGPSLAQKKLSTTPDNLPYLNKRLNSERRDWATFNLGLRATYVFKHNFLLRAGLHYDHSTEVFTFKELDHIEFVVDHNPTTGQNDTIGKKEIYKIIAKTYNRFGMLEIPVMGGFELRSGNMGININAGASVNVLFWKRGQILSPDDKAKWFTPSRHELEVFRPRTGVSVMGSVQWFWHLQPRLRLYVEPYFRQVLQPISVSTLPVEQHHRVWGLNLGVTRILY